MLVNARFRPNNHIVEIQITLAPLLKIKVHTPQLAKKQAFGLHGEWVRLVANRSSGGRERIHAFFLSLLSVKGVLEFIS